MVQCNTDFNLMIFVGQSDHNFMTIDFALPCGDFFYGLHHI